MGEAAVSLSGSEGAGNDARIAANSSRERICRERLVAVLVTVLERWQAWNPPPAWAPIGSGAKYCCDTPEREAGLFLLWTPVS